MSILDHVPVKLLRRPSESWDRSQQEIGSTLQVIPLAPEAQLILSEVEGWNGHKINVKSW